MNGWFLYPVHCNPNRQQTSPGQFRFHQQRHCPEQQAGDVSHVVIWFHVHCTEVTWVKWLISNPGHLGCIWNLASIGTIWSHSWLVIETLLCIRDRASIWGFMVVMLHILCILAYEMYIIMFGLKFWLQQVFVPQARLCKWCDVWWWRWLADWKSWWKIWTVCRSWQHCAWRNQRLGVQW